MSQRIALPPVQGFVGKDLEHSIRLRVQERRPSSINRRTFTGPETRLRISRNAFRHD